MGHRNLIVEQKNYTEIGIIYEWKQSGRDPPSWEEIITQSEAVRAYVHEWVRIKKINGLLYREYADADRAPSGLQILVPSKLRGSLLKLAHGGMTNGHLSALRTKQQVRRRAYWIGWASDVVEYCQSCEKCSTYYLSKVPKQGPLQIMLVGAPFDRLSLDITGPHPKCNTVNVFIVTMVDHFSKWAEAFPVRNHGAETIERVLLENWVVRYGTPVQLLTDLEIS